MVISVFFLGFGEAAQSFYGDRRWQGAGWGYDIKTTQSAHAAAKSAEFKSLGVSQLHDMAVLSEIAPRLTKSGVVFSVVTADQALVAAKSAAKYLLPGTLFVDMNSVAPATKQDICRHLSRYNIDYVDVAILEPVQPKQLDVPLLVAGPKAAMAVERLRQLGFLNVRIISQQVGQASAIKMLRSVMTKGIEALTAECAMAAAQAGVADEVFASMGDEWLAKADYNLDRIMVHGVRRAAEMDEVVKTLEGLGACPLMSKATAMRQREIGSLGHSAPPETLSDKLDILTAAMGRAAQ